MAPTSWMSGARPRGERGRCKWVHLFEDTTMKNGVHHLIPSSQSRVTGFLVTVTTGGFRPSLCFPLFHTTHISSRLLIPHPSTSLLFAPWQPHSHAEDTHNDRAYHHRPLETLLTMAAEGEHSWKFAQCFGDKGDVDDITEGRAAIR